MLFICDFSCFLRKACTALNFPLRTAFAAPHRFSVAVFSLSLVWSALSSLRLSRQGQIHFSGLGGLASMCLFSLHPSFCHWFLVSSHCGQEDVSHNFYFHKFISTFFVSKLWSILENIWCIIKENAYSEGFFFFFWM